MTREELLDIIDKGEWVDVEFKRAASSLPTDVWQTVSAFANTKGGTIGFGIEEKDSKFKILGVENTEKLQSDFLTTLRGEKFNNVLSVVAERHEVDGKNVLVFHINEMPRQAKPIYYGNDIRNSFLRLVEKRLLSMIYQDKPNHPEQKYYADKELLERIFKSEI